MNEVILSKVHGFFIIQVRVDDEELAKAIRDEARDTIQFYEAFLKRKAVQGKLDTKLPGF